MQKEEPNALVVLENASRMLASAESVNEIKSIRDKAEAARVFIKSARLGLEAQNRAAVIKLQAERKAGQWISTLNLRGGDRKSNGHRDRLKLEDLGINENESKRWQREGRISDDIFNEYVALSRQSGEEISSAGLMRFARRTNEASHPSPANNPATAETSARGLGARHSEDCAGVPTELGELQTVITEIENHRRLLADILRPICEQGSVKLERGERRAIGHLLSAIQKLLMQLTETIRK